MRDILIKALRCSAAYEKNKNCEGCRYRLLEPKTDIPVKNDATIDGVEYWESCDADRIAIESAEYLEGLK